MLSGKLRQAVHWATNKEGVGCILLEDICTKTRIMFMEVLGRINQTCEYVVTL